MKTNREEALAIAGIKFAQLMLKGNSDTRRALMCNTQEGLALLKALAPYINGPSGQDVMDMANATAATANTREDIDAYFSQRWAQFNAGLMNAKAELDAREAGIAQWQKQLAKECNRLAAEVKAIPLMRLEDV